MKSVHFIFIIFAAMLSTSCSTNEEISDSEKQLIIEALQSRLDDYADAFKQKDLDRMLSFWSNDPDFAYAFDGSLSTNYDSVIAIRIGNHLPKVQEVPYFDFNLESGNVFSDEAASVAAKSDWAQVLTTGDTVRARATMVLVFKKKNGEWSVVQSSGTHVRY